MGRDKQPIDVRRVRRNIENFRDPYISRAAPEEIVICSKCGSVYSGQRWYLKEQVDPARLRGEKIHKTVCPACRKIHDRFPGGIVSLSGAFLGRHRNDILNLVRNEGDRAMAINPLERLMDVEFKDSTCEILTTNERLAQRIGRALQKAYDGEVAYKWSEDTKLVRVFWRSD